MDDQVKYRDMKQLSQYRAYLQKNPKLMYLFFELTNQCNLSCLHCGSECDSLKKTQLDITLAKKVIDSVSERMDSERIMVCMTGGEPLLHSQFFEFAEYVKRKGFPWGMTTNATLINRQSAKRLLDCGVGTITISLDGTEEQHDWFRNHPGAFRAVLNGIAVLQNMCDVPLQITSVIHKRNINELENIYQLLNDLDIKSWRLVNIEPIGRARSYIDLMLDGEDYRYLLDFTQRKRYDPQNKMNVTYGCSHFVTIGYERMIRDYYFMCGAGIYIASIMCNGDIASCLDIERRDELVQGNITKDDYVDVWEHRFQIFRKDRTEECEMCMECEDNKYCNADSMHTWNFKEKRPNVCIKKMWNADSVGRSKVKNDIC